MKTNWTARDRQWMQLALDEAALGQGRVEPNPMVGCVAVKAGEVVAKGHHRYYGGPHAEIDALANLDRNQFKDLTIYVTLEPCSHYGKTPPCADFLAERRPKKVVIAMKDPFPQVAGRGISKLLEVGIEVEVGLLETEAKQLNAPYLKLVTTGRPWVIGKWAMTLDGAIATKTGDSKWISSPSSRAIVHKIRSRMDAIITGIGTVLADDPMLNARLPNSSNVEGNDGLTSEIPRVAKRVVLDRNLRLPLECSLVKTANEIPLIVVTQPDVDDSKRAILERQGVIIWETPCRHLDSTTCTPWSTLHYALEKLGEMRATNVLLEAGAQVLGSALDSDLIDQIECFVAPKVLGGNALRPVLGNGVSFMSEASHWTPFSTQLVEDDLWISLLKSTQTK